ncbi:MAG: hypothetical protein RLZZ58_2246, partial [Pseudomonadota bacterium]
MVESLHGIDWTDEQNDLIVSDYFAMLKMQMVKTPFVKSHRYEALSALIGKTPKAIEAKHQNVSAVMERLGLNLVTGLRPRANFQNSLIAAIERHLTIEAALDAPSAQATVATSLYDVQKDWVPAAPLSRPQLVVGPIPTITREDRKSTETL